MGCLRLGVAGMFQSADACPPGGLAVSGATNVTLRVAYAAGSPPTIAGDLFFAGAGAAVPAASMRVPLARPLEAVVAGPRAFFAVGAASGYYQTQFTVTALGIFTDAPLNVSFAPAAPSASASPQSSLPRAAFGDVAWPLAAGVAAAAALAAAAVATCRFQQRARRDAGASSSGDGYKEMAETGVR